MNEDIYKKAEKRVKSKKEFYTHFAVYIACTLFFLCINLATYDGALWFFMPVLPWGIGLAIHYFTVFGLPGTDILTKEWEDRELENEIRRLGGQDPNDNNFPMNRPIEENDELELREIERLKRKDDDELV